MQLPFLMNGDAENTDNVGRVLAPRKGRMFGWFKLLQIRGSFVKI